MWTEWVTARHCAFFLSPAQFYEPRIELTFTLGEIGLVRDDFRLKRWFNHRFTIRFCIRRSHYRSLSYSHTSLIQNVVSYRQRCQPQNKFSVTLTHLSVTSRGKWKSLSNMLRHPKYANDPNLQHVRGESKHAFSHPVGSTVLHCTCSLIYQNLKLYQVTVAYRQCQPSFTTPPPKKKKNVRLRDEKKMYINSPL